MSLDKLRQFGLLHFLRRAGMAVIRPVWRSERFLVLVLPDFRAREFADPRIVELTPERVAQLARDGALPAGEEIQFEALQAQGSRGVGCLIDGVLAGHAWIQPEGGSYCYGDGGRMIIPAKCTVMKNLLVRPPYRGEGLGRILNRARLAMLPVGTLPVGFIVADNRIAIRNWEECGFRPVLTVIQRRCLGGTLRTRIRPLTDSPGVAVLAQALREGAQTP